MAKEEIKGSVAVAEKPKLEKITLYSTYPGYKLGIQSEIRHYREDNNRRMVPMVTQESRQIRFARHKAVIDVALLEAVKQKEMYGFHFIAGYDEDNAKGPLEQFNGGLAMMLKDSRKKQAQGFISQMWRRDVLAGQQKEEDENTEFVMSLGEELKALVPK